MRRLDSRGARQRDRGRGAVQRRDSARRVQGRGRGGGQRCVLACRCGREVPRRGRRRGRDRPGDRLVDRGAAGAHHRRADQRHDLAVQRLRRVHPGQRDRGLRGAGRGHHRPVHGHPGSERDPGPDPSAGFFVWEMLDFIVNASLFVLVGLQLHSVLTGWGHIRREGSRCSGAGQPRGDPHPDRLVLHHAVSDPGARPPPQPARPKSGAASAVVCLGGMRGACRWRRRCRCH